MLVEFFLYLVPFVLVYIHVNVVVFTRTPFFPSRLVDSVDGVPGDAWLYFPGLKVGKMYLFSSSLTI
jgi:hypothetical protein